MTTASEQVGAEHRATHVDALCGLLSDATRLQQAGRFDQAVVRWARDLITPAEVVMVVEDARAELRASRRRDEVLARVAVVAVTSVGERQVRDALTDPLTGLASRARMDDEVQHMLALSLRAGRPLTAVILDVDGLKRINDEQGHPAGDAAITEVGRAVREHLRKSDRAYRWGGDEFLLIMAAGPDDSSLVVERIRQSCTTATSYGMATHTGGADAADVAGWLSEADADLYRRRTATRALAAIPARRRSRHLHPARQTALAGLATAAAVTVGWTGLTTAAHHGGTPAHHAVAAPSTSIAPVASAPRPIAAPARSTSRVTTSVAKTARRTTRPGAQAPGVSVPSVITPVTQPVVAPVLDPVVGQPPAVPDPTNAPQPSLVPGLLHGVKGLLGSLLSA